MAESSQEIVELIVCENGEVACENTYAGTEACVNSGHFAHPAKIRKKKKMFKKVRKRIRDPFNKKKMKELKQTNIALETAVQDLRNRLLTMLSTHPRGQSVIGSCGTLQIDCVNNIQSETDSDFSEIQLSIDKLTDAANKLLEELTAENEMRIKENAELKLTHERAENKLDELKDLVLQCTSRITQKDMQYVHGLKDLKDLRDALVRNMSDEQLVSEGIEEIRLNMIFNPEYDFLPFQTKLLVTRLTHLFGHTGLVSLCANLRMDIPDNVQYSGRNDGDSISSHGSIELLLDKDNCARVLVSWVNKSLSNDSSVLLEVLQNMERKRYGQMTTMSCSREDSCVQVSIQEEESLQHLSLSSLVVNQHNSSSDKSLSFDFNCFSYDSLERDVLHCLKTIAVEGLTA